MKYILILSLLFCNTIIGQVHDYNIRIDYPKDPDSVYVLLTGNSGAFAGWGRFNSLPQLATVLQPFLSGGGTWGSITGTLSNQTDLQNALNAKLSSEVDGSITNEIQGIDNVLSQGEALTNNRSINIASNIFRIKDNAGDFLRITPLSYYELGDLDNNASGSRLYIGGSDSYITKGDLDAKFGINTTTPSEVLHVIGNGLFSGTLSASNLSGTNTGDQDLSGYLTSEVDGSTSNELQTITNSSDATSHTVTLSNSGGSVQLIEGSGVTLTTGGTGSAGTVTIAASGGGGGAAYDEYVAIVNQSGTSDPTATVLESLAAGTVVLDRSSNGVYTLVLSSAFTSGKTFISATIGANAEPINFIRMSWIDSSTIQMETQASGSYSDSDDGYFYISIRVYP